MDIVKAPCFNYHGYCLAKVERELKNIRGESVIEVRALHGNPWSNWSHGGWCPTNTKRFYPEILTRISIGGEG